MKTKGKRPSISRLKPKGKKPPAPESMEAKVPRKLTDADLYSRARRLVTKIEQLKGYEARKRSVTREVNTDIKAARAAIDQLSSELAAGVEMIAQGDLFAGEAVAGKDTPPKDAALQALAQVEAATSPAARSS